MIPLQSLREQETIAGLDADGKHSLRKEFEEIISERARIAGLDAGTEQRRENSVTAFEWIVIIAIWAVIIAVMHELLVGVAP